MVLSGLLTLFLGIVGVIHGIFFGREFARLHARRGHPAAAGRMFWLKRKRLAGS
jgi:hypothetical protein